MFHDFIQANIKHALNEPTVSPVTNWARSFHTLFFVLKEINKKRTKEFCISHKSVLFFN